MDEDDGLCVAKPNKLSASPGVRTHAFSSENLKWCGEVWKKAVWRVDIDLFYEEYR